MPRVARSDYWAGPSYAAPRRFCATTGLPVSRDGEVAAEDVFTG
ncbi:hypothetical protein [Actinomadura luzonensis]|nr:hypothetical protein [Actinomadura luzonensis]